MTKVWKGQTAFTAGVLDPRMNSRQDLELFYQGMSVGRNVICLPHGGVKRRPGWKYHATMTALSRLLPFSFNTEQTYAIAFSDSRIDVYKDGVLQTSITSSVPYSATEVFELDYAQSADTLLLFHKDHQPRQLVRTSDTSWAISTATFSNIPQYDFNDGDSPTPVSEVQDVTFNVTFANGDTYKLELEGLETETITYSSATADNESRMQSALLDLTNTGDSGITVAYQSGRIYRVTLANESANDWELLAGRPISIAGNTVAQITVAEVTPGTSRNEDAWSATRGWPRAGSFHQDRLWLGGTTSLPDTLWASRVSSFFNFEGKRGRDDDAILNYELKTNQINVVHNIESGRGLQVFTSGGEFIETDSPITPSNVSFQPQSRFGSRQVKPVIVDGATLYAQRLGTSIREFLFTESENAYNSETVNIRAPHLFNDVQEMVSARGTANEDANYVYVLNGDGTMAIFNTLRSEGIAAWTDWDTDGLVKSITVLDNVLWMCVQRTINGATVHYLEEANESHRLDASVLATQTDSATVTDLAHLNGQESRIRDGNIILANVTPSGGSATAETSVTNPEVGLGWNPTITTMPIVSNFPNGSTAGDKKTLARSNMDLRDSLGVQVGGYEMPDRAEGFTLGSQPTPYTGRIETYHHDGWVDELMVTITQSDPLPFELLGLELEVLA